MGVYLKGRIGGIRSGEFQGRKYASLQFAEENADGSLAYIEVHLPDGFDHTHFKKGQHVELLVVVRAKDSRVSYRYVPPVEETGKPLNQPKL